MKRKISELCSLHSSKTPKRAVFAGSMQLLAGIKLCTGRVLTNHPHYEDQALRERTRQVRFLIFPSFLLIYT